MMPVNLLLVRHGESLGNVAKRLSEQGDHSLPRVSRPPTLERRIGSRRDSAVVFAALRASPKPWQRNTSIQ